MDIKRFVESRLRDILSTVIGLKIDEIDLSAGGPGLKSGAGRRFPNEKEPGGQSINLNSSGGPIQFPKK